MGTDKIRKIAIWVVVAFVAYAIFKSPDKAADMVHNIWEILKTGVTSIGTFFNRLLNA